MKVEYFTVSDLAKFLRIKERTLYSRVSRKNIDSITDEGRILIPKSEAKRLLEEQKSKKHLPAGFTFFRE